MDLDQGVVDGIQDERVDRAVQLWRPVGHGLFGVEYRGQHLVFHGDPAAALLRRPDGVGQDRDHALADEADRAVEEVGVVRIHQMVGVDRRAEASARHVLPGVDPVHAGDRECGGLVDRDDAGVRVGRVQHLEVQHAVEVGVHREGGAAGDHVLGRGRADARADGLSRCGLRHADDAFHRVLDPPVAGAAAEIAFQRPWQIRFLGLGEGGRRHDHSRGAETALESRGIAELPLHRMQIAGCAEPFDRRHLAAVRAEGGGDAAVYGSAVQPYRAGAAIARVTALFDAEVAQCAEKGAQALTGVRFLVEALAVHAVGHPGLPAMSSRRISSAKCCVR